MLTLPFYIIATLVVVYSIFTYAAYVPSLYTYAFYRKELSAPNKELTAALKQLVDAPTLGQFFYQDLITGYVFTNEWEKVLNYSRVAVQSPINRNSFSIWYYKATAECLLNHLEDCERSARIANSLSPHHHEDYVSQLFNLAQVMKGNQNVKLISDKNQIMVVLDSSQQAKKPADKDKQVDKKKEDAQIAQGQQQLEQGHGEEGLEVKKINEPEVRLSEL